MKHVTDTHHALIPTCRHSLKVHSGWRHSSCKIRTITLSLNVWVSCLYHKRWLHRSASNLATILTNFGGDIRHFVLGWPNITGDASPASPAALTPMLVQCGFVYDMRRLFACGLILQRERPVHTERIWIFGRYHLEFTVWKSEVRRCIYCHFVSKCMNYQMVFQPAITLGLSFYRFSSLLNISAKLRLWHSVGSYVLFKISPLYENWQSCAVLNVSTLSFSALGISHVLWLSVTFYVLKLEIKWPVNSVVSS